MEDKKEVFDFTDAEQDAIVGFMFIDQAFFLKCLDYLPHDTFRQAIGKEFTRRLYDYYNREHSGGETTGKITWQEFEGALYREFSADMKTFNMYSSFHDRCRIASQNFDVKVLANRMAAWIKNVKTRTIIHEARNTFMNKTPREALAILQAGVAEIENVTFLNDGAIDFTNPRAIYEEDELMLDNCCTIGHPVFDELLLEGQSRIKNASDIGSDASPSDMKSMTKGGLKPGDVTILLGATNSGKTSCVITVIAANLFMRKKILLITHEQRENDIIKKIHSAVTGLVLRRLRVAALSDSPTVTDEMRALNMACQLCDTYLTYVPWIKSGSMVVEKVVNHIKMRQAEAVKADGKGFDLLVNDYPGKLTSMEMRGRKAARHEELGYIYNELLLLARELKFHAFLPAQTNREGFKLSQAGDGQMVGSGDIAGSYDIAKDADNIISINRSVDDVDRQMVKFYVDKSRSAKAKMTFVTQAKFELARTHWITQPATILHPGQQLPAEALNNTFPVNKPQ